MQTVKINLEDEHLKKLDELGEQVVQSPKLMDLIINGATINSINKDMLRGVIRVLLIGAAAEVAELQSQLAESQRRERAAVEDILDAALTPCTYCEGNPTNEGICDMQNDHHNMFGCWQWRGPQETTP